MVKRGAAPRCRSIGRGEIIGTETLRAAMEHTSLGKARRSHRHRDVTRSDGAHVARRSAERHGAAGASGAEKSSAPRRYAQRFGLRSEARSSAFAGATTHSKSSPPHKCTCRNARIPNPCAPRTRSPVASISAPAGTPETPIHAPPRTRSPLTDTRLQHVAWPRRSG